MPLEAIDAYLQSDGDILSVSAPPPHLLGRDSRMFVSPRTFYTDFHPHRRSDRGPDVDRRLVLLGRSGSGKSATANTLFGRHMFLEARWGRFHTTTCQRGIISRYGRKLEVLDTPGYLLDSDISTPKVKREFAKMIGISSPGPHIFVFVFPTPHMHKCDVEIFQKFVHVFGEEVLKYTILLFSKADDLDYFSLTKQAFVLSAPPEWKAIMKACSYRCVWFQNRSPPIEKELMVRTFLETMENTINRNLGQPFYNDLYLTVEKTIIDRDITNHEQNAKLRKLRRRLRVNLDAGIRNAYGDTRKDPHRTREDFRRDLENNHLKLIDTIWNTIKHFDCMKILRRPKLPIVHSEHHNMDYLSARYDMEQPNTDRSEQTGRGTAGDTVTKRHNTTAQPDITKRMRLPKLETPTRRPNVKPRMVLHTDRGPSNRLPKLVP